MIRVHKVAKCDRTLSLASFLRHPLTPLHSKKAVLKWFILLSCNNRNIFSIQTKKVSGYQFGEAGIYRYHEKMNAVKQRPQFVSSTCVACWTSGVMVLPCSFCSFKNYIQNSVLCDMQYLLRLPFSVPQNVIEERRRANFWLLCSH